MRGVAGHHQPLGPGGNQPVTRCQQSGQGRGTTVQQSRRPPGNAGVAVDQQRHMAGIILRVSGRDHLGEKVCRSQRAHAAEHADHASAPSQSAQGAQRGSAARVYVMAPCVLQKRAYSRTSRLRRRCAKTRCSGPCGNGLCGPGRSARPCLCPNTPGPAKCPLSAPAW